MAPRLTIGLYIYETMVAAYVDSEIVISRLKHLLDAVDEAVKLRVWVDIEEVAGRQLGGHVQYRLDVVHDKAIVKHHYGRNIVHRVSITQVRGPTYHRCVVRCITCLYSVHTQSQELIID